MENWTLNVVVPFRDGADGDFQGDLTGNDVLLSSLTSGDPNGISVSNKSIAKAVASLLNIVDSCSDGNWSDISGWR